METNLTPAHVTPQIELAHELNPGGIEPITVDAPAAPSPKPLAPTVWPMQQSARDAIDGAMIVIALCALLIFALGFVGGVWACKAGGW